MVLFSVFFFQSGEVDEKKVYVHGGGGAQYEIRTIQTYLTHTGYWLEENLMSNSYSKYLSLPLEDKWHIKLNSSSDYTRF